MNIPLVNQTGKKTEFVRIFVILKELTTFNHMKNIYSLFLLVSMAGLSFMGSAHAQELPAKQGLEPVALTPDEMFVLSSIPELPLPIKYLGPDAPLLPSSIDNSTQPYFRPITWQSGYECGQSAGIAFNFTYEIDRLRNLAANTTNNQYPTHFAWDFMNNGDNYTGASCFDGWEIVRACGTMNVTDYGGSLGFGGYKRWISGYDAYYNGMHNRISTMHRIRCDSPDGLLTLKYWLFEHLEGSAVGGVANLYGQYFTPSAVLPVGTPEAGKFVQVTWGPSPSHTWTVCGYNDSIRYDFNSDGLYTNNIDINGDGVVDMRDWEIGGLKIANGYAGTGWGNQGFCYMMYKQLADAIGYGGIWNHSVYIIDTKQNCDPRLTYKVTLKHTCRNKLKVTAGVSTNLSATVPDYILEFPIYKFQGGAYYMQGGTTEADKTIEFGLDVTPLLDYVTSGQMAKFFLNVQENDPSNADNGTIVSYALVDYTGTTPQVITCSSSNVPVANNTTTRLSVNYSLPINKPAITTVNLPPAMIYQPYSYQLGATNGATPYRWDVKMEYPESLNPATFPTTNTQQLTLTNNNSGFATKVLDFHFPFFRKYVDTLYIFADGYIMFDDSPYTWPYLIDKQLLFKYTPIICPFNCDLNLYPGQGDGIWYEGNSSYAIIRWKASIYGMAGSSSVNVAVKFYPNGTLEFYYGTMNYPVSTTWTGGISGGDNKNYQYSLLNNSPTITTNTVDHFTGCGYPVEMNISDDGLFTGTPQYPYSNLPIKFRCTDNSNLTDTKILTFNVNGLLLNYSILSGNDSIIEYGETAYMTLTITNLGSQPINNINLWITKTDPYITLLDSAEFISVVPGNQTITIPNAFSFHVASNVPNAHPFVISLHVSSSNQNYTRALEMKAFAPDISIGNIVLLDGDNGQLDPGETTPMLVNILNAGGAKASNINTVFVSSDPLLTLNVSSGTILMLKPDSTSSIMLNVTAGPQAPFEHLYRMGVNTTAANGYAVSDSAYLFSGEIIEDFETGGYTKFPWYFGTAPWYMDTNAPYEGIYDSRSGWIFDNQESTMVMNINVLEAGTISFMKYVSCENDPNGTNYDYLAFLIDDVEMGRWDSVITWSKETYPISAGYHTIKWLYHKDYSVSAFWDCALIDFIKFPAFEGALPVLSVSPPSIYKNIDPWQTGTEPVYVANPGGGELDFSAMVFDTITNKKTKSVENLEGSYIECYTDGFVPGQAFSWTFCLHNQSTDNENIKDVRIEFPWDITVNTATNFSGGSLGDLVFTGTTGGAADLNWHGQTTGGQGVVKPGETATALVTGTIPEPYMNDVFLVYIMKGDSTGSQLHRSPGYMKLNNFGLSNTWLSLTNNTGSLLHNESDTIMLQFTTNGLDTGSHTCSVIVRDFYNNKVVIPVTMHIQGPVNIPGINTDNPHALMACPNPFTASTRIRYQLDESSDVMLLIADIRGKTVRTLFRKLQGKGRYEATWDGTGDIGAPVPPGVYTCRLTDGKRMSVIKLVTVK